MKCEQSVWRERDGWKPSIPGSSCIGADLVFVFGGRREFEDATFLGAIKATFPEAVVVGCTTAGEICDVEVYDDSITCTAIKFSSTKCRGICVPILMPGDGFKAGRSMAEALTGEDLRHVFVFSDGLNINGTDLVCGLREHLPPGVTLTGGLAADDNSFARTLVLWNGEPMERAVVGVGLYGRHIKIGYGSLGGWDPFGPERLITRSSGNILYELDGMSALDLYRRYLGPHAAGLPATGLLFPLAIRTRPGERELVRTVLQIDEKDNSMIFAGNMPEGGYARFMKANFDRLIDGAANAAGQCIQRLGESAPQFALLISCVGRRMVLKQRVEEEVEGVRDVVGPLAVMSGFYSYGEISPMMEPGDCELHNQTMTITTLSE